MSPQEILYTTAITCMDGRIQLAVNEAMRSMYDAPYVDTITEAGVVRYLADELEETHETQAVLMSIRVSVDLHGSRSIAIVAHDDCAGNPISNDAQKAQLAKAVAFVRGHFPQCLVAGLWLGMDWVVQVEIPPARLDETAA